MKDVMLYVKNFDKIKKYEEYEKKGYPIEKDYSEEIKYMIKEFKENNWNVYLFSLDNFDSKNEVFNNIYNINKEKYQSLSIKEINKIINVMIIRVIGSIEGNFNNIKKFLNYIDKNYNGIVLNNPKAMIKGMTKHYLCDINIDDMKKIGIKTIETKIYSNKITYSELVNDYDNLNEYIIKPVSGELSNSISNLSKIDEDFLRRKENKVQGWVIQPIKKEIYNGEYQMSFLNNELIFSQKKEYNKIENSIPNQKNRTLKKYNPTQKEIKIGNSLIDYFKKLYSIDINICRIDFMKDSEGNMILLEFEMVNPGFFIGYMEKNDKDIIKITSKIRKYCEKCLTF